MKKLFLSLLAVSALAFTSCSSDDDNNNDATVSIRYSKQSISGGTSNIALKEKANLLFYRYLILYRLSNFNQKQILTILEVYQELSGIKKDYDFLCGLKSNYYRIKIKSLIYSKNF